SEWKGWDGRNGDGDITGINGLEAAAGFVEFFVAVALLGGVGAGLGSLGRGRFLFSGRGGLGRRLSRGLGCGGFGAGKGELDAVIRLHGDEAVLNPVEDS